jgi:uncharacterized protein (DUF305 family)
MSLFKPNAIATSLLAAKMPRRSLLVSASLLSLSTAIALCQQQKVTPGSAPIVQPGAPGQPNKTLSPATPTLPLREPSVADVAFMQGMIMHHGQAVEMTALMSTRSHNQDLLALGQRISISQTDEMGFMKRWLEDRGKPVSAEHGHMDHTAGMDHMEGMDHMDMGSMPTMPGMLTPQQMDALRKATGPEFDHLFLTGMIQHHTGALTMVKQLLDTPGAAQDAVLFDFTSDVDNTQQAEIDIMRHMLAKEKQ